MVIWITGLSGSGKSTIARALAKELNASAFRAIVVDGDAVRAAVADETVGFDRNSRLKNAMRISRFAQEFSEQGALVIVATMSLFREIHEWNRENLKDYREVYLKLPLAHAKDRDPRGLYDRAARGEAKNVVGVDLEYDEPATPDLVLDDPKLSIEQAVGKIRGLINFERPLCIMHQIGSTGGQSFAQAFLRNIPATKSLAIRSNTEFHESILAQARKPLSDVEILYGHGAFIGIDKYCARPYLYCSVLREPVARAISSYYYHYYYPETGEGYHKARATSLLDYTLEVSNYQTKSLLGDSGFSQPMDDKLFSRAKALLDDQHYFISVSDMMDEAIYIFARRLGMARAPLWMVENSNSRNPKREEVSPEILGEIRKANLYDCQLYEAAKDQLTKQVAGLPDSEKKELLRYKRACHLFRTVANLATSELHLPFDLVENLCWSEGKKIGIVATSPKFTDLVALLQELVEKNKFAAEYVTLEATNLARIGEQSDKLAQLANCDLTIVCCPPGEDLAICSLLTERRLHSAKIFTVLRAR